MFSFPPHQSFSALMSLLRDKGRSLRGRIDAVVALDARGFLIGPTIAEEAGVSFVPV